MSLLTICQAACQNAPIAAPSAIIGNTQDQTAVSLLAWANLAGQALARRPQGGWISMIREYDFYTQSYPSASGTVSNGGTPSVATIQITAASSAYTEVAALSWIASGTGIPNNAVVTTVTYLAGVWYFVLNVASNQTGSGTYSFGRSDYPLPTDFQRSVDNTFWDRSRFWSMRGPQSPQQWQIYKSSVIGRASIQRRYRFRNSDWLYGPSGTTPQTNVLSIDPTPFDNNAALVFEYVSSGWCYDVNTFTRLSQWESDTNEAVIDEYLIQLNLQWRLLRRLGLSYSEELDEYEREVDKAVALDGGAAMLDLTPSNKLTLIGPWNLPETNFGNVSGS
jgi:hypothetical protein